MTSPLVSRLLAAIERSPDLETRYALMADLGCYWARVGSFQEAEHLRLEIRREFGSGKSLNVSVRVMCLEGLQLYFSQLDPTARDRFVRAHLLSKAAGNRALLALTSSWLAHIDFNLNSYGAMSDHVSECLNTLTIDDVMADCRISLVLGDAFLYADETATSNRWYERARRNATKLGDQAAIGAMTYNRAALRVMKARLNAISHLDVQEDAQLLFREVESAINYQAVAELRSLDHLLTAAKAGCFLLQQRLSEAEPLLTTLLNGSDALPGSAQYAIAWADMTTLLARSGRIAEAKSRLLSFRDDQVSAFPADDLAIIFDSLADAADHCDERPLVSRFNEFSKSSLERYLATMKDLKERLKRFENPNEFISR